MDRRTVTLSLVSLIALLSAAALPGNAAAPEQTAAPFALSDADLFAQFDYAANPALAPVERAWKAGDVPGAKRALAAYLRARTSVPWSIMPHVPDRSAVKWNPRAADAARHGDVAVVTIHHTFPDARIDWTYNATGGNTGLPANSEWTWQLNRMEWWRDFIAAYRATGDETWAQIWVAQLRSWIAQCPPPVKVANTVGSPWRTIECGIRASGILPDCYQTFLLSPSVSDDDLIGLARVLIEHGRYLSACHTGGNWLTMEMNGLYSVGCLLPELKDAAAWRKQASDALYHEQTIQFLPDGAQFELTPGYHNVALDNVLGIYKRAKTALRVNELPPDYVARMEQAFQYDLLLMTPDRSLPKFNDSWPYNVASRMAEAQTLFPARADFAWVGSKGAEGRMPTETSHAFPYAGYFVMRENWERNACLGILDAGPLGNGHYHQDKLNFVAWAYGRELLFDSGGGSYEHSRYRAYATDTFGHNCVLVDGKPQRRDGKLLSDRVSAKPIDARWETTPSHDYAEGTYSEGWGKETDRIATHLRRVLFVKGTEQNPPFWVVSDMLAPTDAQEHTYQARWHLLTTATVPAGASLSVSQIILTADNGQPNLALVPIRPAGLEVKVASGQTEPELLGWNIRKDTDPQYVPATSVLHTVRGTGVQRFLTLLLPLKPGEALPFEEGVKPTAAGGAIHFKDGSVWTIEDSGPDGISVRIRPAGRGKEQEIVGGKAGS